MAHGKRKRHVDGVCMLFPDDEQQGERIPKLVSAPQSLNKAWERCGEGFDGCKTRKAAQSSERKTKAARHSAQSIVSDNETSLSTSLKEPGDIIWSDSDLSNDGSKELLSLHGDTGQSSQSAGKFGYNDSSVSAVGYSGDDSPQIDWQEASDVDSNDKSSILGAPESAIEISDTESSTSDASKTLLQSDAEAANAVEIAEYSSDDLDETLTLDEGPRHPIENKAGITSLLGKSASDWVRTAQVLLQTPEKTTTNACKTPDDSAKKRKRFLGGGLAERLSRLHNRERSAVSFWRHQRDSDCKMPSGDKSGILTLKIIEVHEECSMLVALCQKLVDPSSAATSCSSNCSPVMMLKVLFTRQTAAQLKGQPDDIIHIHPPWLNLTLKNDNIPVILNTHFTQRIIGNIKDGKEQKATPVSSERRRPVPLSVVFKIDSELGRTSTCEEPEKVRTYSYEGQPLASSFTMNDSLLDVVERQGAAGWRETRMRVVVQRVYGLPSRDSLGGFPQGSNKAISSCSGNSDRTNIRLCLLIQDAYGIFSEVHLQCNNVTVTDTELYRGRWEGRACCFSGMKILQRTTRGRAPGLFSLIDSLWPPLLPIKIHGQSQHQEQVQVNLPAPSFCYILAVHHGEGGDHIQEEDKISDFYLPPVVHTLDNILQVGDLNQRCSFWATVIYMKPEKIHSDSLLHKDTWMFVTDVSLQDTSVGLLRPRVLAVCISPSCILDLSLLQTLCEDLPCSFYFKDAVKENGKIICIERTVLSLQKPLSSCAAGVSEPKGPVILDELDSRTEANSMCSVKGIIIGVNETTSFSWPACNKCGSNKLQRSASDSSSTGIFFCTQCSQDVSSPITRMQLEVFLHCESMPHCKVKLKLLQGTISFLLSFCSSKDGRFEVSGIIGREVGPSDCYVPAQTGHPGCSLALEEICLKAPGNV